MSEKKFNEIVFYQTENFKACVPLKPHIPREDGGHIRHRRNKKTNSIIRRYRKI